MYLHNTYDLGNYLWAYILFFVFIFLVGICIGSFLNVCIYRLPKGESLTKRASHCMTCGTPIRTIDLIPVFSWLFLRGKCHSCGEKISPRYPIVESLNGLLYVLCYVVFDYSWKAVVMGLFFSALVVVAFMDWDTQEINLGVIIFIALLAIPSFYLTDTATLVERIVGLFAICVPFFIIGAVTKGIGLGDTLLMGAAGLLLGWKLVVVGAVIGIFIALFAGLIIKFVTKSSKFAFGPWLSAGLALSACFGTYIINAYTSLIK